MRKRAPAGVAAAVSAVLFFYPIATRDRQVEVDTGAELAIARRHEGSRLSLPDANNAPIDDVLPDETACPGKTPVDQEVQDGEWFRERISRQAKALSETNDAEHLLAAALLSGSQNPEASLHLLGRAERIAPTNRIIAASKLRLCREKQNLTCDIDRIVSKALTVDGDNGAVLMEVAMLSLAAKRVSAAEELVRRAVEAPRFDNYFIDYARILERAAAVRGDSNYRDRMIEGIGYSAAMSVSYYKITTFCAALESQDTVWLGLCDGLGEKMYLDGRSLLDQMLGADLRKIAAKQSGDRNRIDAAAVTYDAFRENYTRHMQNSDGQGLLENDETVLRRYVDTFSTYGESAAMEWLHTEVVRLREIPDYDPCNFVPTQFLP